MSNTYSLKRNGNAFLSPHFKVKEFACKDGSDTILINPDLIKVLEKLFDKLGAKAINITSGYRTPSHSVRVGGYRTDQHTKGNAADIKVKKTDGSLFSSKEITLALDDLNHAGGIGLINKNGSVHVDVRGKKCWFDETNGEKLVNSWYKYWGVTKQTSEVSTKTSAHSIGEHIIFSTCYNSSTAPMSEAIAAEKMSRNHGIITKIIDAPNPYLIDDGLCWVNDGDIRGQYSGNSTQSVASTSPAHKGTAYTITCDWLKVRKSPSSLSKVVGKYSRGEIFYVIARKGNWCQLESGNWMCAGKYLKRV